MTQLKVIIIDHDTLRAIGLRYLLTSYFNVAVEIVSPCDITPDNDNNSTIYFTSSDCHASMLDFFIQRRTRTIILSAQEHNKYDILNISLCEEDLINQLSIVITLMGDTDKRLATGLSPREIEVLKLVALGYLNKEIADKLSISINTVLTHRKNISSKLGIRSVSGLSVYAIMNGYISPSDTHR